MQPAARLSSQTVMGGAPIGAAGHDPILEEKGTGGHNLGIIHISLLLSRLYTNVNAANIRIRLI